MELNEFIRASSGVIVLFHGWLVRVAISQLKGAVRRRQIRVAVCGSF
jgi:hypothetical protein